MAAVRATDRNASKKAAERRFPHCVDVPIPGSGLGRRLIDMLDWCGENVPADTWAQHHHSERRTGETPRDFARFYFVSEADTEAFRGRWSRTPPAGRSIGFNAAFLGPKLKAASSRHRQRHPAHSNRTVSPLGPGVRSR